MLYTVYANDHLIYHPRVVNADGQIDHLILEPELDERVDGFSSFTYRCARGTPAYDYSLELKTRIKIYEDGTPYWQGRILDVGKNIRNQKTVYVEDLLGMLCDAVYEPYIWDGSVAGFLDSIVNAYNNQVGESQRFAGVVCDIDEGDIQRSSENYDTCWQVIKQKLLNMIGGFMWVSYDSNWTPTIHYSKNPRNHSTQTIAFGSNLKNYTVKWSFGSFYTACYPLGAKDENTKEYVTIESVNDGSRVLVDETSAAIYGVIFAPPAETTWEDVTIPSNLLTRAQEWLQSKSSRAVEQINLTGVDLATLGTDVRAFHWLDSVRCTSTDFDSVFVLKNCKRRLDDLVRVEISMGDARTSLTGSSVSHESSTITRIENIESDYVTNERVASVTEQVLEESTIIEQKANEIIAEVVQRYLTIEAYEGYEQALLEEIATRLSTMAGEIRADFTYEINEYGTDTQNKFSKIESFIRILAQTPTVNGGLVLGESTSQIKAKLENDVLYFFSGDETMVNRTNAIAYFSAGKLYVNEVQIDKLTVGQTGQLMYFTIIGEGDNRCLFLSGRLV